MIQRENNKVFSVSLVFLFSVSFALMPILASAAEIFFGVNNKDIGIDAKFETGIFINAQSESINAIEGQIIFPSDTFEFQGFYSGNSVIPFWVQQPVLTSQGIVSFSGIMPGGFTLNNGYLFSLILKAKQKGDFTISATKEKILLNDGNGSEAKITKAPLHLNISEKVSAETFSPLYDLTPPETFEPQVSEDKNIFGGNYFLAFATQDKGSGIDHYEVLETEQFGSFKSLFSKNNQWVVAESPYLLQDQSLKSDIYIKAIDRAGNERIARSKARRFMPLYENYFIWIIIVSIGIIFIWYRLWKRKN